MDDDKGSGEPSIRRSKRLEDRSRIPSEDSSDKRGKKRKISNTSSPEHQSKYKLRKFLRSTSPSFPSTSRAGSTLGNVNKSLSSDPSQSTASPRSATSPSHSSTLKAEPDAGSSAGPSAMSTTNPTESSDDNMNNPEDDIARLQNLLEARGVPPHVLTSFGSRMHLFLNRSSSTMSHAQQLLGKLQSKQEAQQLDACVELCQMLVMGNEETLAGFPVRQSVPLLINLLSAEDNMHLMLQACRALTYIMESLPRSTSYVVEAIPHLLLKLKSIQCMDVAEQALAALDMLSKKHAKSILHSGGLSACLCFIDFFSLNAQRSALNITANCCQVVTSNDGHLFMESIPVLISKLNTQDKKLLESCCLTFSRLVEQLKSCPAMLMDLCKDGLITNLQQLLLVGSASVMTTNVFTMVLRILSTVFRYCTSLTTEFIKQDASGTIRSLLVGNKTPVEIGLPLTLLHRSSNELFEILCLCAELLPQLPKYGVFSVDNLISGNDEEKHRQWFYRDTSRENEPWQSFGKAENKIITASCDTGESDVVLAMKINSHVTQDYTLDLSTMKMENEETGKEGLHKRSLSHSSLHNLMSHHETHLDNAAQTSTEENSDDSIDEVLGDVYDITSSRKKTFIPELLHSASKEKEKEDCRLTLLNDEPALYDELCQTMLLLLFEVYRSSATPNVRYKCLHCLLRIIYHSRPDSIKSIAELLPLSSTVAGMLSSQDSRLVIYGLQLSEILMKKQPVVFAVYFKREGVMHAVKKILAESSSMPGRSNIENVSITSSSTVSEKIRSFVGSPPRSAIVLPPIVTEQRSHFENEMRTTRARAKEATKSGEAGSSAPESSESSYSKRFESVWRKRRKPTTLKKKPNKHKLGSCPSPPSTLSPSPPSKDDLQQWVRHQADKFCQKYLSEETEQTSSPTVLDILSNAVNQLSSITDTRDSETPLKQIKSLLLDKSRDTAHDVTLRSSADASVGGTLSSFELLHAGLIETLLKFLTPQPSDRETDVLQRIIKLLEVFVFNAKNEFDPAPYSALFNKVQQCLSQIEHFPVKVNDGLGDSLSKVSSTYQIKCLFRKHPDNSSSSIRQWGSGTVKVDPLAYVQALEKYLLSRGYCRNDEDEDAESSEVSEEEDRIVSRQQPSPTRHRLTLTINNHPLPYNMTMYQAIKKYGTHTRLDDEAHPASHSAVWHNIHTIVYKAYEGTDRVRSSVKMVDEEPPPSSLLEKLSLTSPMVLDSYKGIKVIQLLHILHTISHEWCLLLKTDDYNNPILKPSLLVNQQIAAKVERQLQDPLVIMTSEYPKWFVPLPYYTPFLFPFHIRLELLHATAFDRDRALQRIVDTHPELSAGSEGRTGVRLDKDKRCVDRDSVFPQGRGIMTELAASTSLLEVYYVGEVGTGLGPTLEFYTLLSRAFQESALGMWRENGSYTANGKTYVSAPNGFYPRAVSQVDCPELSRLCDDFTYLGRVLGKALIDNRILDIAFSEPFYRWLLGTHEKMGLAAIRDIDEVLHSSLKQIEIFALKKESVFKQEDISIERKEALIAQITDDSGVTLEDLCLDFVLPGTDIELTAGGKDVALTISNVEEYLCAVVNFTLREGVRKQMEALRYGFSLVMPLSNLQLFYANEMSQLLCGTGESKWTEEELSTTLQPDHGYTASSSAVKHLIQVMTEFGPTEQRAFLKFVTGCPRLPVGGFKSLHPRLTVVKKSVDGPPDTYLPSVMTCVNYLKLPDYTCPQTLRSKLVVAISEGQNSFHLS
ncbi:hypothetical protein ACHWQZ_G019131 [Mnemiopsis leidyi]